jgi:hypothetical protein
MGFIKKLFYAWALTVVVVGIALIADMLFSLGLGPFMFSGFFIGPCFILALLATPYLSRHIKLD